MKIWEMDIIATTHITVEADNYEKAIEQGLLDIKNNSHYGDCIKWENFNVIDKSVGVIAK